VQRLHRPTRIWREPDGDGDGPSAAWTARGPRRAACRIPMTSPGRCA